MPPKAAAKDVSDLHQIVGRENLVREIQEHIVPLREPRIRFFLPSELRDYVPRDDIVLVGECQIMRGEVFVIGGEPGVGKSKAATALAVAGATGADWFGMRMHKRFRTMIVQTENGRYRLQQEYSALNCEMLDEWIRVSEPPPFGLTLTNEEFQNDIRAALASFKPDCVILDPWNAAARDDKQKDYVNTFDALRNLLPTGVDKPALGIVAHTRKPHPNEKRTGGTGLMHILSGSYVLASVPRAMFVMVRGSDEESDNSVVWCNPKNSNGPLTPRSAWDRNGAGFTPSQDFDWHDFDQPPENRKRIALDDLKDVFAETLEMELSTAAEKLADITGVTRNAAYNALSKTGRFASHLQRENGKIRFKP